MKQSEADAPEIHPDFHLIALDETEDWILPEYLEYIERIETVYLYDKNSHTYCCEMRPSYCLYPIEVREVLKPEYQEDEDLRDRINQTILLHANMDVSYYHVADIDSQVETLLRSGEEFRYCHYGDPEVSDEDSSYEQQVEAVLDDCRCNARI